MGKAVHVRVMEVPKRAGSGCFDVRIFANGSLSCLPTSSCPKPEETCQGYHADLQSVRTRPRVWPHFSRNDRRAHSVATLSRSLARRC